MVRPLQDCRARRATHRITDGRAGGVPDVRTSGPQMIQIGTEGGVLPNAVVLPNSPLGYEYNRRSITVTNVSDKNLMIGPAERADVIVDFSRQRSPAPSSSSTTTHRHRCRRSTPATTTTPATRPDVDAAARPRPPAGYGPNTRTIMQFRVDPAKGVAPVFNVPALKAAIPVAFAESQAPIIVPAEGL